MARPLATRVAIVAAFLLLATGLAARGESPAAFDRRCIPAGGVAPPSNTLGILGRRALPAGRIAGLGATRDFHHGLLGAQAQSSGAKPTVTKSGYMFLDFWFLGGYDYNPADAFNPSPKQAKNTIPANVLALNGKKVEIYGNILPLDYDSSGTSTFILNASVDACGFGGVPRINEWIYVAMKPGQKAKTYGAGYEILVRGTFTIAEEVEKGHVVSLYSIVADSVQ